MRTTGDERPSGRFDRVPPSVRHLWSLLYRAVRRHAVEVDRLTVALAHGLDESRHRARGLDAQLADLAELLGDALRRADQQEGRCLALRLRVDELERRLYDPSRRVDALEAREEDADGAR